MPPGFTRARRRHHEQITSTTEDTDFTPYESLVVWAPITLPIVFGVEHLAFLSILYDVADTLVYGVHTDCFFPASNLRFLSGHWHPQPPLPWPYKSSEVLQFC